MTMTYGSNAQRSRYTSDAVLSATPVRLLTMLYDRLLLDLARAESALLNHNSGVASENLLHAQAIVAELERSLDVRAWDGGEGLMALYSYVMSALVGANTHRDVARVRESIDLLEPLRLAWHEAADSLQTARGPIMTGGALGVG